jgi:hypothetical protein
MSSRIRSLVAVTTVAVASVACSATPARPAASSDAATPARALVSCPGGVVRTPEHAAAFYGCESITGDLRIEGSELTDLDTFTTLTEVTGSLHVMDNPKLRSLDGLENLSAAGSIRVSRNPKLESVASLEALTLAPTVEISENPRLVNLKGLDGIERIDTLLIRGNRRLLSVAGFANLAYARELTVADNPRLCAKLGLFPSLAKVDRELSLTRNFGLSAADRDAFRVRVGYVAPAVALAP